MYANAIELGVECAGGVDCVAHCAGILCEWCGGGADCGAGDRLYQCDHRTGAEDSDVSSDPGDAGTVLAGDQRANARTGVRAAFPELSGAGILCCVCRGNRVEPGEYGVEMAGGSDGGWTLAGG